MLVALGENDVKTVEDLADCATDDLAGWSERQEKETIRHSGFLDGVGTPRPQCEDLILAARVKAGWIDEADLIAEEEDSEGEEETGGETEGAAGEATAEEPQGNETKAADDAPAS